MTRFLVGLAAISLSLAQTVQISVDRNRVEEGELFTLSIEVNGSDDFAKVDMNQLEDDFEILSGPGQQTNIQWINGSMTSTKTLTWTLSPKRGGTLAIPALSGTVDGKSFRGKPIPIQVIKSGNAYENTVFLVAEVDKEKAYLGEQVTLTYKLYKHVDVSIASIDQFQMPEFPGFWAEDLYTPQRLQYQAQQVTVQGVKYQVANLGQRALFPIPSDNHTIPSVKVKAHIEIKKKKRRRDPFFDPFFDSFFSERKTKVLRSKEKNVIIQAFPEPRPFDFSGAVGEFSIGSGMDRETAKVNEGFTFTVAMTGTGNLGLFSLPEIKFPDEVEAFPPTDTFEKDAFRDDLTGTQSWEYILIPRQAGNITIPRIQMSYFDPNSDSWKRTQTDPIEISVAPGDTELYTGSGLTKREVELIGQDIRFIHTDPAAFNGQYQGRSSIAILLYLFSVVIFISPTFISQFTGYRLSTAEGRQIRGALRNGLKELKKKSKDPFETASCAFYIYLKNKFVLPSHNLDPTYVESILGNLVEPDLMEEVLAILKVCDAGRFAPGGIKKEATLLNHMADIMKRVERNLI